MVENWYLLRRAAAQPTHLMPSVRVFVAIYSAHRTGDRVAGIFALELIGELWKRAPVAWAALGHPESLLEFNLPQPVQQEAQHQARDEEEYAHNSPGSLRVGAAPVPRGIEHDQAVFEDRGAGCVLRKILAVVCRRLQILDFCPDVTVTNVDRLSADFLILIRHKVHQPYTSSLVGPAADPLN